MTVKNYIGNNLNTAKLEWVFDWQTFCLVRKVNSRQTLYDLEYTLIIYLAKGLLVSKFVCEKKFSIEKDEVILDGADSDLDIKYTLSSVDDKVTSSMYDVLKDDKIINLKDKQDKFIYEWRKIHLKAPTDVTLEITDSKYLLSLDGYDFELTEDSIKAFLTHLVVWDN